MLREELVRYEGFVSAERFSSVVTEGKAALFDDFRIPIAKVEREYTMSR